MQPSISCDVLCKVKLLSCAQLFVTPRTVAPQAPPSWDFPGKNTGMGCHFLLPSGDLPNPGIKGVSSIAGKLFYCLSHQGIPNESESHSVLSNSLGPHGPSGQNRGVGSSSPSPADLPNLGSTRGLLHCRRILYQLSYQGILQRS